MTIFPLIARELRVRARNRGTYWGRFGVVLCGLIVCLPQFASLVPFVSPSAMGKYAYDGLLTAAFLLSCGACFLTSDALSAERREGTLPLLLLTRVRPFDIVLGKFGSTGLAGFGALVALLPLLMIPVFAGGVTGGEAFRQGFACLNALFFSLAVGLYASATGLQRFKTGVVAAVILAAFLFLPLLVNKVFSQSAPIFSMLSPLAPVIHGADAYWRISPWPYWLSLLATQVVAWWLLLAGSFSLTRPVLAERFRSRRRSAPFRRANVWNATPQPPVGHFLRPGRWRGVDMSPVEWLVHRQPGLSTALWTAAFLSILYQISWMFLIQFRNPMSLVSFGFGQLPGLVISLLSGALVAWAASRFSAEARRTGELELLLTTPLGARTFIDDQWRAMRRLLFGPALLMLVPVCLSWISPFFFTRTVGMGRLWHTPSQLFLLHVANILLSLGALCWLSMWLAFKEERQSGTILRAVGLVRGLPFLIALLGSYFVALVLRGPFIRPPPSAYQATFWLPQMFNLCFYIFIIHTAKRRLNDQINNLERVEDGLDRLVSATPFSMTR